MIPSNADMDRKFQQAKGEAAVHHRKVDAERVKRRETAKANEAERIARFDSRLKKG